ncbi:ABC transporter permease [bacterium]|nr:ABC transporter permease [bacterium]
MFEYLLRRLVQSLVALWAISVLVFVMMFAIGNPVATLLPPTATDRQRAELRQQLHLDDPLPVQYFSYIGRMLHGDFGHSYYTGRPVAQMLAERAPATIELAMLAMIFAVCAGVPLGIFAGAKPNGAASKLSMTGSLLAISMPSFWLGLLLMMIFGVWLRWLPPQGRGETVNVFGIGWSFLTLDGLRHLILPALTLGLYHLAMLIRLTRSEMARTLQQPFIRVCRARGLSETMVIGKHALRNTLIPVVTVVGLQFGGLLAFSVVTETIFSWPGLGKLLIDSIHVDRPLVFAYLLMAGIVFLAINLLVDLTYSLIDPRIRLAKR